MDQVIKIIPFRHPDEHFCEALAISCMDWRYPDEFELFIREDLGINTFDHVKLPGAARAVVNCKMNDDLDPVADAIKLAVEKHGASKVIIINHADCGKEGGRRGFEDASSEKEHHRGLLKHARAKISYKHSGLDVVLLYADLTEDGKLIKFILME